MAKKNVDKVIQNLLNLGKESELFQRLTVLQNEINIAHDTKVLAITSINDAKLSAAFAKALADAYRFNNSSCLLIDANLYDPCLLGLVGQEDVLPTDQLYVDEPAKNNPLSIGCHRKSIDENNVVVFMDKQTYPSDAYKTQAIQTLVKESRESYEHIIIVVPTIKDHKEAALFVDILDSAILVTERSYTKKRDIYDALVFFDSVKIPVAKTIVVK